MRGLSRPFLLALRSTFRRKGRLALTLAACSTDGGTDEDLVQLISPTGERIPGSHQMTVQ